MDLAPSSFSADAGTGELNVGRAKTKLRNFVTSQEL